MLIRRIPLATLLAAKLTSMLKPQRVVYNGFANDRMLQLMVGKLIKDFSVSCFVETGTYEADTTCFMADNYPRLRILSCELDEIFYNKSLAKLLFSKTE